MRRHSDIRNFAMSSAARGRLSLLIFAAHSRHSFALSANACCTCAATSLGESAITPELVSAANRYSQIDAKSSEAAYDIRCAVRSGLNHIQDPALAVIGRQHSIRAGKLSKFGADGKSKHLDFFRCDSDF